jgi:ligand-binding SRPBCC domain-containing protein
LTVYELRRQTFIPAPLPKVFEFFSAARNLGSITPSSLRFRMLTPEPIDLHSGAELRYSLRVRGIPVQWKTIIEKWNPPYEFTDYQAQGPYKLWHHTHLFREGDGGTWMEDVVRYGLPFGVLGRLAHWLVVRRDVEAIFEHRAEKIRELFGAGGKIG